MSDADNSPSEEHIEDGFGAFTKIQPVVFLQKLEPADRLMFGSVGADDYYEAAKVLVDGCADGSLHEGTIASPALYLVRHYLELQFKSVIFWARQLKDWENNASEEEIEKVGFGHPLEYFWLQVKQEATKRIPHEEWSKFDIPFVDDFVCQFDACDPDGQCFRYNTMVLKQGRGKKRKATRKEVKCPGFQVDFSLLRQGLLHVHEVLSMMECYFIEQHSENAEWNSIQDSW